MKENTIEWHTGDVFMWMFIGHDGKTRTKRIFIKFDSDYAASSQRGLNSTTYRDSVIGDIVHFDDIVDVTCKYTCWLEYKQWMYRRIELRL